VVLTKNEKYAIVSNTVSFSLSSFRLSNAGGLTRIPGPPPDPAIEHVDGAPIELALSRDGKFVYAANVDAGVLTNDPNAVTDIQTFKVRSGGRLKSVGTSSPLATTYSGLAAW
jgi:hypothetical protein